MKLNTNEKEVVIESGQLKLKGILGMPEGAKGIVIFAHGSGSGRLSSRNQSVARELQKAQLGTLLMDLLTDDEESNRSNVFDMELLSRRLNIAKKWVLEQKSSQMMSVAFFGASTGGGASLIAAGQDPKRVFAVVSRGGRPDLAKDYLPKVKVPTLLIVGGNDHEVIGLNEIAFKQMKCAKEMKIVAGATHLFEEPGALEQVSRLASDWFTRHLPKTIWNLLQDNQII